MQGVIALDAPCPELLPLDVCMCACVCLDAREGIRDQGGRREEERKRGREKGRETSASAVHQSGSGVAGHRSHVCRGWSMMPQQRTEVGGRTVTHSLTHDHSLSLTVPQSLTHSEFSFSFWFSERSFVVFISFVGLFTLRSFVRSSFELRSNFVGSFVGLLVGSLVCWSLSSAIVLRRTAVWCGVVWCGVVCFGASRRREDCAAVVVSCRVVPFVVSPSFVAIHSKALSTTVDLGKCIKSVRRHTLWVTVEQRN